MSDREWEDIKERLNNEGKMRFIDGATEDQIAKFENEHQILLPIRFKEWRVRSDGGELFLPGGVQLYGVHHPPTIDVDYNDRPDDSYIVIGALAAGDPILCSKSSNIIAVYDHEANMIHDDEVYSDFEEFINGLTDLLFETGA